MIPSNLCKNIIQSNKIVVALHFICLKNLSTNFEPISWIGNLAADAARLLHNQKKEQEAEKYRQMLFKYEKQYKEEFGRNWRNKL